MFKLVPMRKVFVLGLKDHVESLTGALAATELIHLERLEQLPHFAKDFGRSKQEGLERRYHSIEEQYQLALSILGLSKDITIAATDLIKDLQSEVEPLAKRTSEIYEACERLSNRRKELQDEEKHLSHVRNLMEMLRGFDVDLKELEHMRFMRVTLGVVGQDKAGLLMEGLRDRFIAVERRVHSGEHLVMVIADREDQPIVEKVLSAAFFQELILPEEFLGHPAEVSKRIDTRLLAIRKEEQAISEDLKALRDRYGTSLADVGKKIHCANLHFFARGHFQNSKETLILTGWLPKEEVSRLSEVLSQQEGGADLMVVEDATVEHKKVKAPTLLKNSWLFRPFENILKIYGLPNYRELDPTAYLTIGFVLMFGMMFGDIGHGLFLGSIGAWLKWGKRFRKSPLLKDVGFLILACGAVSTTFGFLYGSVFGFEDIVLHLWFNPFHQLEYGLTVGIAWGVAFILGGTFINIANRFSNGQYIEAGLGRTGLAGIWFYLGSLALMVGLLLGIAALKTFTALAVLCLLPLALIALKEPLEALHHHREAKRHGHQHEKPSTLEIFILSVMEIYDTILSYLSNTLSFMRIAAFALNHVALLLAVFAIAQIIRDGTGSGILYWFMVAVGNLAVVGLEAMIVTIQTFRLIYYEGFSKFYSGDGVAYQPFSASTSIQNTNR